MIFLRLRDSPAKQPEGEDGHMGTYVVCSSWGEHGGSDGVSTFHYNEATGALSDRRVIEYGHTPNAISGSSHFIDESLGLIYMVDEIDKSFDSTASGQEAATQGSAVKSGLSSGGGGSVVVWRYGAEGALERVQQIDSFGSNPAMVTISPNGTYAVVAHHGQASCATQTKLGEDGFELVPVYSEPNIVLFARNADGTLNPDPLDIYQIDATRTEPYKDPSWRMSHMHSCVWAPAHLGDFFVVCDKGTNHVFTMTIHNNAFEVLDDIDTIDFCAEGDPCLATTPDPWAKPRYVRFHPEKRFFFVNYEAANHVDAFSYTADGKITHIGGDTVIDMERRCANDNMKGYRFEAQDLKVSADGSFLYDVYRCSSDNFKGTTRVHTDGGFQGVAVFSIDQETGEVKRAQNAEYSEEAIDHTEALYAGTEDADTAPEAKGFYWPRGIELSPDGKFLLVAFLHGDWIASTPVLADGTLDVEATKTCEMNTPSGFTFYRA